MVAGTPEKPSASACATRICEYRIDAAAGSPGASCAAQGKTPLPYASVVPRTVRCQAVSPLTGGRLAPCIDRPHQGRPFGTCKKASKSAFILACYTNCREDARKIAIIEW